MTTHSATGAVLLDMLERTIVGHNQEYVFLLTISGRKMIGRPRFSGLKYEYNPATPEFRRARKVLIQEVNGEFIPLELDRVYKLATNDFITHGGGAIYYEGE